MPELASLATVDAATPMGRCLQRWQQVLGGDHDALATMLADDVVLHSPVLFKPLPGKDVVAMYLTAASMTFLGEPAAAPSGATDGSWDGRFRYVREVVGERDAVLEFETTMNGKYVNGVDMIRCNDDGLIVDFKVMVRPMQAVEAVSQMMSAALDTLKAGG